MKTSQLRRVALPVRGMVQRFALALLLGLAVVTMALDHFGNPMVERARTRLVDGLTPFMNGLSHPVVLARGAVERVQGALLLYTENERLRAENERLRHWEDLARRLEMENQALRATANAAAEPKGAYVTARVIAASGGAFVRTLLINAGESDGVAKGQAVVGPEGLVGRVVEVGRRSARVLLLTDLNSRVPVRVESSRVSAILAGDNSDRLALNFLPADAEVRPDDRLVTSGEGGLIPPGIPAGIVAAVEDGAVIVRPMVDWYRLEYVRVLNYALPGVLPSTREAGLPGEGW